MKPGEAPARTVDNSFRPVLAEGVEIRFFKEDERGKFYMMRHPITLDFIKIHEHAHEAIKQFNGDKTISDIRDNLEKRGTPIEVNELVSFLANEGFIKNLPTPADKKMEEEKWYSHRKKLLTLNEKNLAKISRVFFFTKTSAFKIFYVSFCLIGFALFVCNIPSISSNLPALARFELPLYIFILSAVAVVITRILHEVAHALAYFSYGGKSIDSGIEFHFLMPMAYADTPDAYWMESKQRLAVFAAGPLSDLFFAEISAYLAFFGPEPHILWAATSLLMHLDILISLVPIIRTDGYYIMQTALRFPNLLDHGLNNILQISRLVLRKMTLKDYKEHLSGYSIRERKILIVYTILLPIVVISMIYFSVAMALKAEIVAIILLAPQILTGKVADAKMYLLWTLYIASMATMLYSIARSLINLRKRD